jgi:hypothetical protein
MSEEQKKEETTLIIDEVKQLPPEVASDLQASFEPLFQKAQEWKIKAQGLTVTSAKEAKKMKEAREARLELKRIRVDAEKVRKQLKEESLLKGKAIDGMYNIIKFLIQPIEQHLEEQEKFIERQEAARLDTLEEKRVEELSKYVEDVSIYHVRDMSNEAFTGLLNSQKQLFEINQKEEKEAERKRQEEEEYQREKEYRENKISTFKELIQAWELELELPAELTDSEKFMSIDREAFKLKVTEFSKTINQQVADVKAENDRLKKEREEKEKKESEEKAKREAEEAKRRKEEEKKLEAERKAREDAERKLAEQKSEEMRKQKEAEEAKKKAEMAPDKEKLRALANTLLNVDYPEVKSEEAKKIIAGVKELMRKVNVYVVENIDKL